MKAGKQAILLLTISGWLVHNACALRDPFVCALNTYGSTGLAVVPHADVLPEKRFAVGIHNFSPEIVFAWPYLPGELGVVTTIRENEDLPDVFKEMSVNLKFRLLEESRRQLNLACGLERSELRKNGFFVVADRRLPSIFGRLMVGYGWQDITERMNGVFCGIAANIYHGMQLLGEYDGDDVNLGFRLLLSPQIKIDALCLGLRRLRQQTNVRSVFDENVSFGLSIDMKVKRPWKRKKKSN